MRQNQLFLRDLVGVVVAIAVITTIALTLAPTARAPSPSRTALAPAGGARLFESKGCAACHTVDGTAKIGPSLQHAFGSVIALEDGSRVTVDDAYLRESVLQPRARSRAGYGPTMPSFEDLLSPRELDAIVAYVRSLE